MRRSLRRIQLSFLPVAIILAFGCNRHSNSNVVECTAPEQTDGMTNNESSEVPVLLPGDMYGPAELDRQLAEYLVEIFEDSKGNLWFGTMRSGAGFYSDYVLKYFTPSDGLCGVTVSSFAEDREGNIWLGSHSGLSKYNGENFTTVWTTSGRHDQGLGWVSVTNDNDGNVWAANNKGLFKHDGNDFVKFDVPIEEDKITSYSIVGGRLSLKLHDSDGNLWFAVDGYGAIKYDGENFTHFSKEDGLCSNNVTRIIQDKAGKIWFTCIQSYQPEMTDDGGLCYYDGEQFVQFNDQPGLHHNDLYTIYEDRDGTLWIGASGYGVYRYNGETFDLIKETDRMDLTESFGLQDAYQDRNGVLWFGFSGGLFQWKDGAIVNVTKADMGC